MYNPLNLSLVEGNLTHDPELVWTKNHKAVCKFDIAVNFNFKTDEKDFSDVSFITVNAWNKTAEVCAQYLKKGSKVRVKGRIKQDTWKDSQGNKRNKIYIEASNVDFLGNSKKNAEEKEEKKESVV